MYKISRDYLENFKKNELDDKFIRELESLPFADFLWIGHDAAKKAFHNIDNVSCKEFGWNFGHCFICIWMEFAPWC